MIRWMIKTSGYGAGDGYQHPHGEWVEYAEAARLEAERDALKAEVENERTRFNESNRVNTVMCRDFHKLTVERDSLKAEVDRLRALLQGIVDAARTFPPKACGASMLFTPQISVAQVELWEAALRGEEASNEA